MQNRIRSGICWFTLSLVALVSSSDRGNAALMIVFTGSTGNAAADAGFQLAANYIQSQFTDNVTVTIQRGFAALGPGILGQAGSTYQSFSYNNFRNAVVADASSANDATFSSNLPAGGSFASYMNRTSENGNSAVPYVDTTGTNTTNVDMTTANAKALGLSAFAGTDAQITFSSLFTWDFDNTNGINPGAIDFVGVATHELMHAMGFVSAADDVDYNPGLSEVNFRPNPLDFTRHSAASFAAGADVDITADARAKYFSLNGGLTNLTPGAGGGFSTGVNFGDGRQSSHWKDNLGWGIMDPTSAPAGQANVVTNLDLQALDVIGWNRVAIPEPSGLSLVAAVSLCASGFFRRRRVS